MGYASVKGNGITKSMREWDPLAKVLTFYGISTRRRCAAFELDAGTAASGAALSIDAGRAASGAFDAGAASGAFDAGRSAQCVSWFSGRPGAPHGAHPHEQSERLVAPLTFGIGRQLVISGPQLIAFLNAAASRPYTRTGQAVDEEPPIRLVAPTGVLPASGGNVRALTDKSSVVSSESEVLARPMLGRPELDENMITMRETESINLMPIEITKNLWGKGS